MSTVKRNSCWYKTSGSGGWLSSTYTSYQCGDNNCAYGGAIYPIGTIFPEKNIPVYFPEVTCSFKEYLYSCPNGGNLESTTCTKIDTEYKLFSSF